MSIATLENQLAVEVAAMIQNPKFKRKDILEWSSGECKPESIEETTVYVKSMGLSVTFLAKLDKRGQ